VAAAPADTPFVTSVLEFINRVRTIRGRHELGAIALLGTERDDEDNCVVGWRLSCPSAPPSIPTGALTSR
jgi:hypothetical protein